MSDPRALLEVSRLRGGYGQVPVLHGIDLRIREGEVVGLLGHNGMGKSTLLKTIAGLLPGAAGTLTFDGEDVTLMPAHLRARRGLGYVPQGRGVFSGLTVQENLAFAWHPESGLEEQQALDDVVRSFPRLEPLLNRKAGTLSGGEQQILALARCLMADPVLVLLDEPTEGIQPSIIDEIAELLSTARRTRDLTILVVEQNLDFLAQLCDRLLLLERGTITSELGPSEMANSTLIEEFAGLGGTSSSQSSRPGLERHVRAPRRPESATNPDRTQSPGPPNVSWQAPLNASPPTLATPTAVVVPTRGPHMTVRRPTLDQMRDLVSGLHMRMDDQELVDYMQVMEGTFEAYDRVDALPDNLPEVKYPRTPGRRPGPEENPLNAWYVKSEVRGSPTGALAGKQVVLKDNVCLAGVPMMNGASTLEGYTPDVDATIVTRILDAGGTIVGKAHCEFFCLSGGSHTNATGPVHNPYKMGHTAGGSSSGSGALVGSGEVGMAIGGDQGGSIRIPASFCGCYGMKPTHGLVPYTGVMPIEPSIDHTGPMTTNVADNALLLEVLAGSDGLDPRQYAPRVDRYTDALGKGVNGLRIGVVTQGFGLDNSEPAVDEKVRNAADLFARLGARVEEVSIPMHSDGPAIWTPIALEGLTATMMHGNGFGSGWKGLYVTSLRDNHANWRGRADELSKSLKISMFVGQYMLKHNRGHYYSKAQNLSRVLRKAYDDALANYDVLLMPTLPMTAPPLPASDAPLALYVQRAFEMVTNTAPFDATGHPSMSIPCGISNGLPVGVMLTAKHYDESTIYRAAAAFEKSGDWRAM
jgi:amidase